MSSSASASSAADGPSPPDRSTVTRPKYCHSVTQWEYATVPLLVHATKQILDNWGEDGWELVQVIPGPGGGEQLVAYLKRPRQ